MNYEVHLFGGNTDGEGQVGICINNTYGSVCDDFWDELDATVICHQLKLDGGHAIPISGANFSIDTTMELIAIDNVRCLGSESSISECLVDSNPECDHFEAAGVICQHPGMSTIIHF